MAGPVPADILCGASDLVTLLGIARRLADAAADVSIDAEALCQLAKWDPALTARLLAGANEKHWGQSGLIDCLTRAATVLGDAPARALLSGTPTACTFAGISAVLETMDTLWSASTHTAIAAQEIAHLSGKGRPDVVFVAGLLLDVGRLAMLMRAPAGLEAALERARANPAGQDFDHFEREQLGYDHALVGATLMTRWRLPACLKACAAYHHRPERARNFRAEVAIVHIANSIAILALRQSENFLDAPTVAHEAWARAGIESTRSLAVLPTVQRQAAEARRLFAL